MILFSGSFADDSMISFGMHGHVHRFHCHILAIHTILNIFLRFLAILHGYFLISAANRVTRNQVVEKCAMSKRFTSKRICSL